MCFQKLGRLNKHFAVPAIVAVGLAFGIFARIDASSAQPVPKVPPLDSKNAKEIVAQLQKEQAKKNPDLKREGAFRAKRAAEKTSKKQAPDNCKSNKIDVATYLRSINDLNFLNSEISVNFLKDHIVFLNGQSVYMYATDTGKVTRVNIEGAVKHLLLPQDDQSVVVISTDGGMLQIDTAGTITKMTRQNKVLLGFSAPRLGMAALQEPNSDTITVYTRGVKANSFAGSLFPIAVNASGYSLLPIITYDPKVLWINSSGKIAKESAPMIGEKVTTTADFDHNTIAVGTDRGNIHLISADTAEVTYHTGGADIFSILIMPNKDIVASSASGQIFLFKKGQKEAEMITSDLRLSSPTRDPLVSEGAKILVPSSIGKLYVLDSSAKKVNEISVSGHISLMAQYGKSHLIVVTDSQVLLFKNNFELALTADLAKRIDGPVFLLPNGDVALTMEQNLRVLELNKYKKCLK